MLRVLYSSDFNTIWRISSKMNVLKVWAHIVQQKLRFDIDMLNWLGDWLKNSISVY